LLPRRAHAFQTPTRGFHNKVASLAKHHQRYYPYKTSRGSSGKDSPEATTTILTVPSLEDDIGIDDILSDDDDMDNVVCARGVCVIADDELAPELCYLDPENENFVCEPNTSAAATPSFTLAYLWPRALLLFCSMLYGTNFPLGRMMNEALPASAATSARMLMAALALSPFLLKLDKDLRPLAFLSGSFVALGYITQSIALIDTPGATVAFLGALVVVIPPALSAVIDGKRMGLRDVPQVWLAAILCLVGVGALELGPALSGGGAEASTLGGNNWAGDAWSVLQAVGFGTSFFITEKMMTRNPDQALPITAMQVGVTAFCSAVWAGVVGTGVLASGGDAATATPWLMDATTRASYALPGLFNDLDMRTIALAVVWTGLFTTAANRVGETLALGKVSSAEASVLLATEPLWAALFGNILVHETLSGWDITGGALIVTACCCNAIKPETIRNLVGLDDPNV